MAKARRNLRAVNGATASRVLLYLRVSELMGRGGEDFHSPDIQLDAMRRAIVPAGLQEVAVIDDDIDQSGQTFNRPGIARIRDMVEARQVDVVAVYELSRVGRDLAESLTFIKWLRKRGVSILSAQEKIDDTPEGQFLLGLWLNLAELFGNQIGRRWAQIIERRARLGKAHGRPAPGYTRVDKTIVPDPIAGPAMAAAFHAYAAGEPISDVRRAFVTARGGHTITNQNLKALFRNRMYIGRVVVDTKFAGRLDMPGEHQPLVDPATWERVQRRLEADKTMPTRHLNPQYSLTGVLRCDVCGHCLQIWHGWAGSERDAGVRRVRCMHKMIDDTCTGIGTPLYDPIEALILDEVKEYTKNLRGNPVARAQQQARVAKAGLDAVSLERELSRTQEAMGRLTERWALQKMPEAAYERAIGRLAETEQALLSQLRTARDTSEAPAPGRIVALVDRMLKLWPEMTGTEQNRGLKLVLRSVTVRRAGYWREPPADCVTGFDWRW